MVGIASDASALAFGAFEEDGKLLEPQRPE
jgi:hypothetical protein